MNRSRTLTGGVAALALIGAVALLYGGTAPVAIGAKGKVKSKVTLNQITTTVAKGKVKSKKGKCLGRRRVRVIYEVDGSTYASARTGKRGKWVATGAAFLSGEEFIAELLRKKAGRVVCKGDRSPALTVGGSPGPGPGPGFGPLGNPSGRMVFRVSGDPPNDPPGNPALANGIYRVAPTANATPENLTVAYNALTNLPAGGTDEFVNVSPDGAWLVSQSGRFGCQAFPCLNIVRGDLTSGSAVQIAPPAPAGTPGADGRLHVQGSAAVASGGNRIVFVSDDGPHGRDLWVSNRIAGNDWGAPVLLTGASPAPFNVLPAISDDGAQVLFNCATDTDPQSGDQAICRVNADGTGFAEVVNGAARPEPHQGGIEGLHHPDFLANGAGIVFESTWGGQQSIWTLAAGQTVPRRLPAASSNEVAPCALPSGHVVSLDLTRPGNPSGLHELGVSDLSTASRLYPLPNADVFDVGIGCGA